MPRLNDADFDEMFAKMENNTKRVRNGVLGIGVAVLLIALALTVIGVVLAVTVSPWFWIAVVVTGGYTLIAGIWTFVAASMTRGLR